MALTEMKLNKKTCPGKPHTKNVFIVHVLLGCQQGDTFLFFII